MPTEKEIELEARLVAIENLAVNMAAFSLELVPDDVIKKSHDHIRQHLRGVTIPGSIDPSLKDQCRGSRIPPSSGRRVPQASAVER